MGKGRSFEFVIKDAFSPETLPMARLAEYMADLATVVGEKEHVHFLEVRDGSAAVAYSVDHEAVPKTEARIRAVRANEADPETMGAFHRLDKRLRADNAHAILRECGDEPGQLLHFPGATAVREETYGPFREATQLTGVLIRVGGTGKLANVNIEDGDRIYFCEADRAVARDIARHLYGAHIRVSGTGTFERDPDEGWQMTRFRISTYEVLDDKDLVDTVTALRAITKRVGMDDDILLKLATLRDDT